MWLNFSMYNGRDYDFELSLCRLYIKCLPGIYCEANHIILENKQIITLLLAK